MLSLARRVSLLALVVVVVGMLMPPADAGIVRPVMGGSRLSPEQIAAWFQSKAAKLDKTPCFTHGKAIPNIAKLFVREGAFEGVRGDIAFAQAIIESNYFTFTGRVPCWANNYSGLGATDSTNDFATFGTPRQGVRAQIQHLRRYADPTAQKKNLHKPLVDPRFRLVKPPGKAPSWDDMGNGNWATAAHYGGCVMKVYNNMLKFNGLAKEGRRHCA